MRAGVAVRATEWKHSSQADRVTLPHGGPVRRHRRPGRSGRGVRDRGADQPAPARRAGPVAVGGARRTRQRCRQHRHHGRIHAPQPRRLALLGWQLWRVLRGGRPGHGHRRSQPPPRHLSCRAPPSRRSTSICGWWLAPLQAPLHDLRGLRRSTPRSTTRCSTALRKRWAEKLREAGSWGVLYHSVRHAGGLCVGVFRPRALKPARQGAHIALHWDGARITHWYEKRAPQALA